MRNPIEKERLDKMRNDPQYNIWGFIYLNPKDPRFLVPKRLGIGWTLNFAHPHSYLFLLGIIAIILLISHFKRFFH